MSVDSDGNGTVAIADIDNLGAVLNRFRDRLDSIEATNEELREEIENLKQERDGREVRLDRVIGHARRAQQDGEDVDLDYSEVMAAADVTAATAYSYMDTLAERHETVSKVKSQSGKMRLVVDGGHFNAQK